VKASLDFEEEVGGIATAIGHALDDLDAIVHAFQDADVESAEGTGDDAIDLGSQPFGESEQGRELAVHR
jgi:hypothetical protein